MNSTDQLVGQESWLRLRPKFLSGCAAVVAVLILPDVIARFRILEGAALLSAALAILVGWFLLLKDSPPKRTWRSVIALITSVYLVASLPVFLFELSPWRWFVRQPRHSWFSMYSMPWVHWGYIFMFLSIIGSFLGRGRSRIAFVTGSVLLMALREATGTWVF
jgi:L-asparagine transporter-like permease